METKKYELLDTDTKEFNGHKLFRIRALIDFGNVNKGKLGGYVEKEENLSHEGAAWIYGNAVVSGNAEISGNAWISDDADYLCFKGLGSCNRSTTFFKCKDGHIHVACACFGGDLDEFAAKVRETHGNSTYAREYLACIDVVKIHFGTEEGKNGN